MNKNFNVNELINTLFSNSAGTASVNEQLSEFKPSIFLFRHIRIVNCTTILFFQAARNCLVNESGVVKVSDFGMTRY